MPDLFKEFTRELRILRKYVEFEDEFSIDDIVTFLKNGILEDEEFGYDPFNKKVLLYRIVERNKEELFTKQSLLKFLSEWEIELC